MHATTAADGPCGTNCAADRAFFSRRSSPRSERKWAWQAKTRIRFFNDFTNSSVASIMAGPRSRLMARGVPNEPAMLCSAESINSARSVGIVQASRSQRRQPDNATSIVPLPSLPVSRWSGYPPSRSIAARNSGARLACSSSTYCRKGIARPPTWPLEMLMPYHYASSVRISSRVVAIDFPREYFERRGFGPPRHQFPRRLSKARLAYANGLVRNEIPVFQSDNPMLDRLLNFSRPPALETRLYGRFQLSTDPRNTENPSVPVFLQTCQLEPHCRNRRETRFFYPVRNEPTLPGSVPE